MYTMSFSIECVYWTLRAVFFLVSCLWEFVCELSNALFSLCPSRYVFFLWETGDLFPGALDHCLPHHYIHQWFNCSPWLDLSKSVLIHFSFDLFFSSHGSSFVLLTLLFVHIDLHSMFDIFHISFLHIPSAVQYSSFFSLSSLIYSSWIISSSPICSYWTSSNMWFMRLSAHIAFYTQGYEILIIGYLSLVSFRFFHPITLAYITSWVLRPPWGNDITHYILMALTWAIFEIGQRAFWLWWTKSCGMTLHLGHSHLRKLLSGMQSFCLIHYIGAHTFLGQGLIFRLLLHKGIPLSIDDGFFSIAVPRRW